MRSLLLCVLVQATVLVLRAQSGSVTTSLFVKIANGSVTSTFENLYLIASSAEMETANCIAKCITSYNASCVSFSAAQVSTSVAAASALSTAAGTSTGLKYQCKYFNQVPNTTTILALSGTNASCTQVVYQRVGANSGSSNTKDNNFIWFWG